MTVVPHRGSPTMTADDEVACPACGRPIKRWKQYFSLWQWANSDGSRYLFVRDDAVLVMRGGGLFLLDLDTRKEAPVCRWVAEDLVAQTFLARPPQARDPTVERLYPKVEVDFEGDTVKLIHEHHR